jgi:hypothetical protein
VRSTRSLVRENSSAAKSQWATRINESCMRTLRLLTISYRFSVACGDLLLLENGWYVTHAGLLRLARRRRCIGMHVEPATEFSEPSAARWAFKATVYKSAKCKGFVGYGDADPTNVSFLVQGAEMRIAETRAVNRALRKAYGIGICSVEEIGSLGASSASSPQSKKLPPQPTNGNYGGRTVRDHLCQLIRQYQLDATLVKSYATDFCGVKSLREATREQVESFVAHLSDWAEKNRDALLCRQQLPQRERRCRMRRRIVGLHEADPSGATEIPDSLYLVRVDRAQYRHKQRPHYLFRFAVIEPQHFAGRTITARLYCTPKALWKLNWFLRDFGYDTELIGRDEIEEGSLLGLRGIIKISHAVVHGTSLLNLDGFAPAAHWEELSPSSASTPRLEAES